MCHLFVDVLQIKRFVSKKYWFRFQIENHDSCVYDFLEFRDGADDESRVIGKHCGYKIPQGIKSTGNILWVRFKSDGSVQKPGFAAKFLKGLYKDMTEIT